MDRTIVIRDERVESIALAAGVRVPEVRDIEARMRSGPTIVSANHWLEAAITNAAEFLNREDIGRAAVGARVDVILPAAILSVTFHTAMR